MCRARTRHRGGPRPERSGWLYAWCVTHIQQDFYDDPAIYDVLHSPDTAEEVAGLVSTYRRFSRGPMKRMGRMPRWLEPASGSGRYCIEAAGHGVRSVGVDLSASMTAYARERARALGVARRCTFIAEDIQEMRGAEGRGPFDFAFCPINSIRHLPSDAAMVRHLVRVRELLAPDAVYAVGISLSKAEWEMPSEDVWEASRDGVHVKQVVQYVPPGDGSRVEKVFSVMHVNASGRSRTIESAYDLRTYTLGQWHAITKRAGMEIVATVNEEGEDLDVRELGYQVSILGKA